MFKRNKCRLKVQASLSSVLSSPSSSWTNAHYLSWRQICSFCETFWTGMQAICQENSPECLGTWKMSTTHVKGLEVPCQNAFQDKPAFVKRLMKDLFLVPSSSCSNRLV